MKAEDVRIGGIYQTKVRNSLVTVKITGKHESGGWDTINTATEKTIHIKTAGQLVTSAVAPKKEEKKVVKKAVKKVAKKTVKKAKPAEKKVTKKVVNKVKADTEKVAPDKRVTLVGAAIEILRDAKEPMACKDIVELALERKIWEPAKGGKTPANTLYATFLREIKSKGNNARFKKALPGKFELNQ